MENDCYYVLKNDGTISVAREGYTPEYGLLTWSNVDKVDCTYVTGNSDKIIIMGLKKDGTVILSDSTYGNFEFEEWTDIVDFVYDGYDDIHGIKKEGTIVHWMP